METGVSFLPYFRFYDVGEKKAEDYVFREFFLTGLKKKKKLKKTKQKQDSQIKLH